MLAHTETHTTQHRCIQSHKESRRAEKEKKKRKIPPAFSRVCFWPLRPVWKHEWEFCKSMGTTDLVSSKSTADWHVFHVISCIVERWERLSSSDWLVKACFAVVHACVKGGSICLTINDAPTSSHSSVRHWIMSNITPPPPHHHPHTNKRLSLSSSPFKNHWIYDSGFQKSSSPVVMAAKYPSRITEEDFRCVHSSVRSNALWGQSYQLKREKGTFILCVMHIKS